MADSARQKEQKARAARRVERARSAPTQLRGGIDLSPQIDVTGGMNAEGPLGGLLRPNIAQHIGPVNDLNRAMRSISSIGPEIQRPNDVPIPNEHPEGIASLYDFLRKTHIWDLLEMGADPSNAEPGALHAATGPIIRRLSKEAEQAGLTSNMIRPGSFLDLMGNWTPNPHEVNVHELTGVSPIYTGRANARPTYESSHFGHTDLLGSLHHAVDTSNAIRRTGPGGEYLTDREAERRAIDYAESYARGAKSTPRKEFNEYPELPGIEFGPSVVYPYILPSGRVLDLIHPREEDLHEVVNSFKPGSPVRNRLDQTLKYAEQNKKQTPGMPLDETYSQLIHELQYGDDPINPSYAGVNWGGSSEPRGILNLDPFKWEQPFSIVRYSDAGQPSFAVRSDAMNEARLWKPENPFGGPKLQYFPEFGDTGLMQRELGPPKTTELGIDWQPYGGVNSPPQFEPNQYSEWLEHNKKSRSSNFFSVPSNYQKATEVSTPVTKGTKINVTEPKVGKDNPFTEPLANPQDYTINFGGEDMTFEKFLNSTGTPKEHMISGMQKYPDIWKDFLPTKKATSTPINIGDKIPEGHELIDIGNGPEVVPKEEAYKIFNMGLAEPSLANATGPTSDLWTPIKPAGGTHGALIVKPPQGDTKHIFKPTSARAGLGEEFGSRIANYLNTQTPLAAYDKNWPGLGAGTMQRRRGGLVPMFGSGELTPADFSHLPGNQLRNLGAEHPIDWLIGNFDAHKGQFFTNPRSGWGDLGRIVPLDKGQAFKYSYLEPGILDHPNEIYGEDKPIYLHMRDMLHPAEKITAREGAMDTVSSIDPSWFMNQMDNYTQQRMGLDENFTPDYASEFMKSQEHKLKTLKPTIEKFWK